MNIKTILIAGGTGFVGSYFIEALIREGRYQAILLKRSSSSTWRIDSILPQIKTYDIDHVPLEQVFSENPVDLVMNFAADHKGELTQLIKTNVAFGQTLFNLALKHNVRYYGNIDTTLDPGVNAYAQSKAMMREWLKKFRGPIKVFNFKLQYIYGPKDSESKFIPFAISKLRNNEALNMTLGGQEIDFIHVKDCASALLHVIGHHELYPDSFEEFNIGTGETIKLKTFVESLKKNLQSVSPINYGAVPYRSHEIRSKADPGKLRGWLPAFDWRKFRGES